ncbi:MAG: transposase [Methanobacteriota archaeon]
MKCLVLKTVFRLRYRELVELLEVSDKLVCETGLTRIPHFTTLQKFAARFPCRILDWLITLIAKHVCGGVFDVAIDSTGYSLDTSSYHYSKRIGRKERHRDYVKTTVAVDTKTLVVAAVKPRLKRRHDLVDAKPVLRKAAKAGRIQKVIADKGYDSEEFLEFITQELQAKPVVALKYCDKTIEKTHGKLRKKTETRLPRRRLPTTEHERNHKQHHQKTIQPHNTSTQKQHPKNRSTPEIPHTQLNTHKNNRNPKGFLQSPNSY